MTDKPALTVIHSPQGNRYSERTKDLCYQVWALKGKRSPTKTWNLLNDPKWRDSIGLEFDEQIPDRSTIEYWSKEYKWLDRFHTEIDATGGAILYQAKAEVILGTNEAAGFLRDVVNNDEEQTNNRIKAAELLMNYGIGRDSAAQVTTKPRDESDIDPAQLAEMSTESLLEMARQRTAKFRKVS